MRITLSVKLWLEAMSHRYEDEWDSWLELIMRDARFWESLKPDYQGDARKSTPWYRPRPIGQKALWRN